MGKIMLNGIQYGVGGIEQAKDISYDNTESGATATDVQGALDELTNGLTTVRRVAFSKNVTYGAGASGYDSINMASDVSADNVIAIQLFTASVSSMGGCSITPLYVDNNSLYWSYRANTAVNNVPITFLVSYLDN